MDHSATTAPSIDVADDSARSMVVPSADVEEILELAAECKAEARRIVYGEAKSG